MMMMLLKKWMRKRLKSVLNVVATHAAVLEDLAPLDVHVTNAALALQDAAAAFVMAVDHKLR